MLTEAIHTPFLHDRLYSLDSTQYVFNAARSLGKQIDLSENSDIAKRAELVLNQAHDMLTRIKANGLLGTLATGEFADIKRPADKGKGFSGVVKKAKEYLELL
jgi:beta-lysine 5,6-aminomutase alpha subunit